MAYEKHDEIAVLVMAVERLAESLTKTNEKVDKLVESMSKQEVILEKLAHIEKSHQESNKRVHKRIDTLETTVEKIIARQESGGCPTFRQALPKYDAEIQASKIDRELLRKEVEAVVTDLDELEKKPMDLLFKVAGAVMTAIVLAGLVALKG